MGTFQVAVEIGSSDGSQWEFVEALVDTGASHSIFPASLLHQLGIESTETWPFRLADERQREFGIGQARMRMFGRERVSTVVFGDDTMQPILGATTLEDFMLAVDPVRQTLVEVPGLLMYLEPED
ncbi:MAG TPA: retroviral-like aspartic protease family protein [Dehalococcoidia bacterium]|nr:retroviral-like aspartic protease family protein [Dehalococcoidia bacterium]